MSKDPRVQLFWYCVAAIMWLCVFVGIVVVLERVG